MAAVGVAVAASLCFSSPASAEWSFTGNYALVVKGYPPTMWHLRSDCLVNPPLVCNGRVAHVSTDAGLNFKATYHAGNVDAVLADVWVPTGLRCQNGALTGVQQYFSWQVREVTTGGARYFPGTMSMFVPAACGGTATDMQVNLPMGLTLTG